MADLQRNIEILFTGRDQLTGTIGGINTSVGRLSSGLASAAQPLAGIADSALKTDAALAALAGGGLAYAFAKSMDLESAMAELRKVLDATPAEFDAMKEAALDLSDKYGIATTTIVQGAAEWVQAGYDQRDALALVEATIQGAIAGSSDYADVQQDLTRVLKGFNYEASEAGRVLDVTNAIANKYATSNDKLLEALATIAPVAKTAGISLEEMAGFLTPVIESFQSGTEAGTAFKTGLLKLTDDSKPVLDSLKLLGVSQTDANGALRSGRDILYDVAENFNKLDQNQQNFVASQLFGIEQTARLASAFTDFNKVQAVTQTALDSTGSVAKEVATRLETSRVAVDRFKQAFVNVAATIGDEFRDSQTEVINSTTNMINAIRRAADGGAFDPLLDELNEFNQDASKELDAIAEALPEALALIDWDPIIDGLGDIRKSVGDLFQDVDLTTPEGLADALQMVVDAVGGLLQVTDGMVQAFGPFFRTLSEAIDYLNNMTDAQKEQIGQILLWAKAFATSSGQILAAFAGVGEAGLSLNRTLDIIFGAIKAGWETLQAAFDAVAWVLVKDLQIIVQGLNNLTFGRFEDELRNLDILADAIGTSFWENVDELRLAGGQIRNAMDGVGYEAEKTAGRVDTLSKSLDDIPNIKEIALRSPSFEQFADNLRDAGVQLNDISDVEHAIDIYLETNAFDDGVRDVQRQLDTLDADEAILRVELEKATTEDEINQIKDSLNELEKRRQVLIDTALEMGTYDATTDKLDDATKDRKTKVEAEGTPSIDEVGRELDEAAPEKKKTKIEIEALTETQIAQIKADAETVQTAIEWEAKLDIANVEANAQRVESIADLLSESFASTGDVLSSAFDALSDLPSYWEGGREILKYTEQENNRRERLANKELQLADQQMEYLDEATKRLGDGQVEIKLSAEGLTPALEAVMRDIIERIQVQAVQSGNLPMLLT